MVDTIARSKKSEQVHNNNALNRSSYGAHTTTPFCDLE